MYLFREFFHEAQLAHQSGGSRVIFSGVDFNRKLRFEFARFMAQTCLKFAQSPRIARLLRFGDRFAPLHLRHQEIQRHRGIGFLLCVHAVELQQIARTTQRIAQRLIGLVHQRGTLHRDALFRFAEMRRFIGMNLRLQGAVLLLKPRRVYQIGLCKAEQLEMILLEVEAGGLHQIWKLSPQPHSFLTLGLLNLKPSFSPSRWKSSSMPSI